MNDEAAKSVKDLDDYLGRGRLHEGLSDDQLRERFIGIFQELARSSSFESILPALHDVEAEYHLRQLDPPYDLVRDDAETFIQKVSAAVSRLDCGHDI